VVSTSIGGKKDPASGMLGRIIVVTQSRSLLAGYVLRARLIWSGESVDVIFQTAGRQRTDGVEMEDSL
jgi:hypothetical protein